MTRGGSDRYSPRTLDLDLLLYGEMRINEPRLTVPHPGIQERSFVLRPLADIAAALILPGGKPVQELCNALGDEGLEQLAEGTRE